MVPVFSSHHTHVGRNWGQSLFFLLVDSVRAVDRGSVLTSLSTVSPADNRDSSTAPTDPDGACQRYSAYENPASIFEEIINPYPSSATTFVGSTVSSFLPSYPLCMYLSVKLFQDYPVHSQVSG